MLLPQWCCLLLLFLCCTVQFWCCSGIPGTQLRGSQSPQLSNGQTEWVTDTSTSTPMMTRCLQEVEHRERRSRRGRRGTEKQQPEVQYRIHPSTSIILLLCGWTERAPGWKDISCTICQFSLVLNRLSGYMAVCILQWSQSPWQDERIRESLWKFLFLILSFFRLIKHLHTAVSRLGIFQCNGNCCETLQEKLVQQEATEEWKTIKKLIKVHYFHC